MYKLKVVANDKEFTQLFQSEKDAKLYRDYHVKFGQWASCFSWVRDDLATAEEKKLVMEEQNSFADGVVHKFLLCGKNIEITLESVKAKSVKNQWKELREKRDEYLKETDWTQLGDTALSMDMRKLYRDYRNYLRVLPTLHNDDSIATARVCTFSEWRNGER